ncbi:MAG: tryptophan synthase subunit alpha, partial [Terracidiphilus sp.]
RWTKLPVAVGFGISNAEHFAQVAEFADAAVVGSAIVELIERSTPETAPGAVARFITSIFGESLASLATSKAAAP